jgi:hypothetical protein
MPQSVPRYSASTGQTSLTAQSLALTIQQPAASPPQINMESAVVYCSVACTVTASINGTPATATAGTAIKIPPSGPGAMATIWTASNAGSGTTMPPIYNIPAGSTVVIGLSQVIIQRGPTTNNYTLTVGSITGTANITFLWNENQ